MVSLLAILSSFPTTWVAPAELGTAVVAHWNLIGSLDTMFQEQIFSHGQKTPSGRRNEKMNSYCFTATSEGHLIL
jgi:hypothetical protein